MDTVKSLAKKITVKRILALLFVIVFILGYHFIFTPLLKNRAEFGVWNPNSLPDRMQCYKRSYHLETTPPQTLTGKERPSYSIRSTDNQTGKELYTKEPKGELVPTEIFLKTADGKYQAYVLSGGQ